MPDRAENTIAGSTTESSSIIHNRADWRPWLAGVAVLAVTILQLHRQGRRWWCACGQWDVWSTDAWGSHNSQHFVDPYSLSHVLHGVLFYGLLAWSVPKLAPAWRMWLAVVIECAWEVVENTSFVIERYRAATAAQGYEGDSVLNSVGDIVTCAVGVWLAGRLGLRWSIALIVAVEVLLLIWIRDSLGLNILMLLWPIDAIRNWQLGG